eukprot:scaffold10245_cov80-Phaeocystis_antarctica.AAC.4
MNRTPVARNEVIQVGLSAQKFVPRHPVASVAVTVLHRVRFAAHQLVPRSMPAAVTHERRLIVLNTLCSLCIPGEPRSDTNWARTPCTEQQRLPKSPPLSLIATRAMAASAIETLLHIGASEMGPRSTLARSTTARSR